MSNNQDLHDEGISRLYKAGEQLEPPSHLDAKIKQAARAAAPTGKRRFVWPSLATAAVLVLSVSLILKVMQQEPLEDSEIGSSATSDEYITPPRMLQEEAIVVDSMDKEQPKLQRYHTSKRKAAPALAKPQKADTIKLEAAPVSGEVKSRLAEPVECHGIQLPETASKDEWISMYHKALEQGDAQTAACLQQVYQARFDQAIPTDIEK